MESTPKRGMATTSEITRNARKLEIITNIENISCEKGFIPRNAVNAIITEFFGKDNRIRDKR